MQPAILSRRFWRSKLYSLRARSSLFRSGSIQTTIPKTGPRDAISHHSVDSSQVLAPQFESGDIAIPQVVARQIASQTTYTVQAGDTFSLIAKRLGIAVDAIESANPGVSPTSLQIGQILNLQPPSSISTYTIVPGDTLTLIAVKVGSTVTALKAANPDVNPNNLQIGSRLSLYNNTTSAPAAPQPVQPNEGNPITTGPSSGTYTIQPGDTFYAIAEKVGISELALEAANPSVNVRNLQIGSQITLPSSALPPPVQPVTPTAPVPTNPVPAPTGPTSAGTTYIIQSGDTFVLIAARYGTTAEILEAANPSFSPTNLKIGAQMRIPQGTIPVQTPTPTPTPIIPNPAPVAPGTYTIQSGDTFFHLAAKYAISVAAIEAANPGVVPTNLKIGQVINIPTSVVPVVIAPTPVQPTPVQPVQPVQPTTPSPLPENPPTSGTYVVQAGDTFVAIAAKHSVTLAALQAANPGVVPHIIKIGQTINLPLGAVPIPGAFPSGGGGFVDYSGPASNFPDSSQWAPYATLWAQNAALMSYNDSPAEIALIGSAITVVAAESGIDARIILCILMQESGGNVRVGNTFNGVNNTGIMQAFDGVSFNPSDPAGSILQMIRDGAEGTARGPGLKQNFADTGNWYEAARKYNSGSVDKAQLNNALGATGSYVAAFANRLMGHTWPNM
jgi:LysM repeat protein